MDKEPSTTPGPPPELAAANPATTPRVTLSHYDLALLFGHLGVDCSPFESIEKLEKCKRGGSGGSLKAVWRYIARTKLGVSDGFRYADPERLRTGELVDGLSTVLFGSHLKQPKNRKTRPGSGTSQTGDAQPDLAQPDLRLSTPPRPHVRQFRHQTPHCTVPSDPLHLSTKPSDLHILPPHDSVSESSDSIRWDDSPARPSIVPQQIDPTLVEIAKTASLPDAAGKDATATWELEAEVVISYLATTSHLIPEPSLVPIAGLESSLESEDGSAGRDAEDSSSLDVQPVASEHRPPSSDSVVANQRADSAPSLGTKRRRDRGNRIPSQNPQLSRDIKTELTETIAVLRRVESVLNTAAEFLDRPPAPALPPAIIQTSAPSESTVEMESLRSQLSQALSERDAAFLALHRTQSELSQLKRAAAEESERKKAKKLKAEGEVLERIWKVLEDE